MVSLTVRSGWVRFKVRVQPRSARNRVAGVYGDALKVQVSAPPVEGAANNAVVEVLAAWLRVSRKAVEIVRGQTGRDKVVAVTSGDPGGLAMRIRNALEECVDKAAGRG